jgi:hypothetical protein
MPWARPCHVHRVGRDKPGHDDSECAERVLAVGALPQRKLCELEVAKKGRWTTRPFASRISLRRGDFLFDLDRRDIE